MGAMSIIPKSVKKVEFAKNNDFPKMTVGTMALWAGCQKIRKNWNLEKLQFFKIGCGHYGLYEHYSKKSKKRWNLQHITVLQK